MKIFTLIAIFFLIYTNSFANAQSKSWSYDVYYDDDLIGEHVFKVAEKNDFKHIQINASFDVKFFFINAYSYRHSNKEVWQGQCLYSIESSTEDNGTEFSVFGEKKEDTFSISVNKSRKELDSCIQSFSYWDKSILGRKKLLNSQTGEIENIKSEVIGRELITARDQQIMADHYRLIAEKFSIELWYSDQGEWLALRSTTEDGNVLTYKLKRSL